MICYWTGATIIKAMERTILMQPIPLQKIFGHHQVCLRVFHRGVSCALKTHFFYLHIKLMPGVTFTPRCCYPKNIGSGPTANALPDITQLAGSIHFVAGMFWWISFSGKYCRGRHATVNIFAICIYTYIYIHTLGCFKDVTRDLHLASMIKTSTWSCYVR